MHVAARNQALFSLTFSLCRDQLAFQSGNLSAELADMLTQCASNILVYVVYIMWRGRGRDGLVQLLLQHPEHKDQNFHFWKLSEQCATNS